MLTLSAQGPYIYMFLMVPCWYEFCCGWFGQLLFLFLCKGSYMCVTFPGRPLSAVPVHCYILTCRRGTVPIWCACCTSRVNIQCWTVMTLYVYFYVLLLLFNMEVFFWADVGTDLCILKQQTSLLWVSCLLHLFVYVLYVYMCDTNA
jgi:hypothetical protein